MCCVCARARARLQRVLPRSVGGVAMDQGRGEWWVSRPSRVDRPASQGQESLEICETEMLGFCGTDELEHQLTRPSHLSLGFRVGSRGGQCWW